MIWMSTALIALVLSAIGYAFKKRRPSRNLVPIRTARKIVKASPSSVSVELLNSGSKGISMGTASLLRGGGKAYREGKYLYLTAPDKLKSVDGLTLNGSGQLVSLSFLHRGVLHSVTCRMEGRKRVDQHIALQLDESTQVACRIHPVGRIKKEERRSFLRYLAAPTDDGSAAAIPYISFDTFVRRTNSAVAEQAGPAEVSDIKLSDFKKRRGTNFDAVTVVNQLRAYMLVLQSGERKVDIARIGDSKTLVGKIRTQLHHADHGCSVNLLDLEEDRDLTSFKAEQPSGRDSRYSRGLHFNPEDRVVIHFVRSGKHYETTGEVTVANSTFVTIRPTAPLAEEAGLELSMVDFSAGGAMIKGGRKLAEFLLGKPLDRKEMSSDNPAHVKILRRLRRWLVHFTFYPHLHFPQVEKRFHSRLPHKICVLGQIMRSEFVRSKGKEVLQHGVKFIYDEQPAAGELQVEGNTRRGITARRIAEGHGNQHFNEVHTKLGRLSGFLESRSRDGAVQYGLETEIRDNRVAFVMKNRDPEAEHSRQRRAGS